MKRLIRKILREQFNYKEKIFKLLNSGQEENIEMVKYLSEGQGYDLINLLIEYFQEYSPPYFKIFNILELTKEEQEYIMKKIYGNDIYIRGNVIYDHRVNNENGKIIYIENSDGNWYRREYDNGNLIYHGNSYGGWKKWEYDDKGKQIYYEDSDGFWVKREYDDRGNRIYWETSKGLILDNR